MPNKVYDSATVQLIDGTEIFMTPLKIKYLREFMELFEKMEEVSGEDETLDLLVDCTRVAMKQYFPSIKTIDDVQDLVDIKAMYKILEISAGIKINEGSEEPVSSQAKESSPRWADMDLVALESELFLLGIWKDYDDLESCLSMPELTTTLNAKRESEYREKKFLAAMQGVDLDKQTGKDEGNAWEKMKAKVFSGGKASDPNDITSLQGPNAQKAGFGIGLGLGYEKIDG